MPFVASQSGMRSRLPNIVATTFVLVSIWFLVARSLPSLQPDKHAAHKVPTYVTSPSHDQLSPHHGPSAVETNEGKEPVPERVPADLFGDPIEQFVAAIMNPSDTKFNRMKCPAKLGQRYKLLKAFTKKKPRYFFALDLYQSEAILPQLFGSIVQAIRYLGPENCVVSVVEGRSEDATYPVLRLLRLQLEALGTKFHLQQDSGNPWADGVSRIQVLAELRNLAIKPLINHPAHFHSEVRLIFINDIAVCGEDILELIYQNLYQSAKVTCGMDWIHDGEAFYDVWVSRTINSGNLFFEIPQDAGWNYNANMFWDDPETKVKFEALQPFEVYACWGGLVVIEPTLFIDRKISFRSNEADECYMGEPTILGKDLWKLGQGGIAVVPTVNVGYGNEETTKIKKRRGYVSTHIDIELPPEERQSDRITWATKPPGHIKCVGIFWNDPTWVPPV